MPITPTYPGVYIEELPSGVRTITGVATSIAAFLGYFSRGPMNEAVRIFSFGDFERTFGGLRADSEASYAIQQFFLNGGGQAYVVRTAAAAPTTAQVTLQDDNGTDVLILTAADTGVDGNALRVEVDYAATDPATQFRLLISEAGGPPETHTDLTLANVVATINTDSNLVTAELAGTPANRPAQTGTLSAVIDDTIASGLTLADTIRVFLNGADQGTFDLTGAAIASVNGLRQRIENGVRGVSADLGAVTVQNIGDQLRITVNRDEPDDVITFEDDTGTAAATVGLDTTDAGKPPPFEQPEMHTLSGGHNGEPTAAAIALQDTASGGASLLLVTARNEGAWGNNVRVDVDYGTTDPSTLFNVTVSEVGIVNGRQQAVTTEVFRNLTIDAARANHVVDVVNSGSKLVEMELIGTPAAGTRPAASGTTSMALPALGSLSGGTIQVQRNGAAVGSFDLATVPSTPSALAAALQSALRGLTGLEQATVDVVGSASTQQFVRLRAGTPDAADILTVTDTAGTLAQDLGLNDAARANVQQYTLGGAAAGAQALPTGGQQIGHDGGPPDAAALIGDANAKTGLYALLDVDLFNILCIPDTMRLDDAAAAQVAAEAVALCEAERAFYLLDVPQPANPRDEVTEIQEWLDDNATLRHRNAALYYPRPQIADALNDFRRRAVAASGTMAGVYARTDSTRGVWKAPAGTEAALRGVQKLEYKLTDAENGVLNPLGINCLRNFPVYGNVAWGARTLDGADQMASEWKYVPVRRLALFLEESLYRGTQWAVFEPNDEPLWAQLRLNVGSFMHNLFRQGAFQGTTPRDAYFVKCDSETTTQADINLGIVNIIVGFAPLKPAEFVIIKFQQMAGQLET